MLFDLFVKNAENTFNDQTIIIYFNNVWKESSLRDNLALYPPSGKISRSLEPVRMGV